MDMVNAPRVPKAIAVDRLVSWLAPLLIALFGCPACTAGLSPAASSPGWASPAPPQMQQPEWATQYVYSLAQAGDWLRFDREAAIPYDVYLAIASHAPPAQRPSNPARAFADARQQLQGSFAALQARSVGPVQVEKAHFRYDEPSGLWTCKVRARYSMRTGATEQYWSLLLWFNNRFFFTGFWIGREP
jgi:hypothetical protein